VARSIHTISKFFDFDDKFGILLSFSLAAAEHTTGDAANRPQFIRVAAQGLGHRKYRTIRVSERSSSQKLGKFLS